MIDDTRNNKSSAMDEREQIRELFKARASNPPIPNPLDAKSMAEWEIYCEEMRELEAQLVAAGETL